MDDRIVKYERRSTHIMLTCKNHPEKRWSTKNIQYIGARSIFYDLRGTGEGGPECDCPLSALRPLTEDDAIVEMFKEDERYRT